MSNEITRWELPGDELHRHMDTLREQGPIVPVECSGTPAWLITNLAALHCSF